MYEVKTETTAKNVSVLLEPILLVIVWLGVVAVAVAVILPLYSLLGAINPPTPSPAPVVEMNIIPETVSPSPTPTVIPPRIKILPTGVGYLNVRVEPSLTAGILRQVKPGDIFEFEQNTDNWYQIKLDEQSSGWVFGDYVEEIN